VKNIKPGEEEATLEDHEIVGKLVSNREKGQMSVITFTNKTHLEVTQNADRSQSDSGSLPCDTVMHISSRQHR
jgi:hypothetical protein